MLAMLMVMSDMDLSHDELGFGWIGFGFGFILVELVWGMQ
jgi:hypothetical protein